ncbi:hypothetical protein DF185_19895 [Marinifilum breve]|uniref:Uncharacterized protein n=1 Tax=Marinifilum breve TaxID=2184082 RepID=A0A2V3ZST5_9BACT|nr:hypothetical protein [Marinifilum breve]PXX96905.1 hypothetical protein DF185_19895 [Marinifilum breve]
MKLPAKAKESHIQKVIQEGTSFDKIQASFLYDDDRLVLSHKDQELKERWEAAFSLLCNYHSNEQSLPILMQRFGISRAAAYRDIANAKQLFGDITQSNKEADRYILNELAMKTFRMAVDNHDVEGMNRAISNMIKLKRLDQNDPANAIDPSMFEKDEYMIVVNSGGRPVKLDLMKMKDTPEASRKQVLEAAFGPATDVECEEIMNS